MNLDENVKLALLGLLEEEKVKVMLNGSWMTGEEALKHGYVDLVENGSRWMIN